jgi:hypothetical protein
VKYLKEYKEHLYYQSIESSDFWEIVTDSISIDMVFTKILNWLNKNYENKFHDIDIRKFIGPLNSKSYVNSIYIEIKDVFYVRIQILLDNDEWFYVKIVDEIAIEDGGSIEFYKCDQIEGLFSLLKDKLG